MQIFAARELVSSAHLQHELVLWGLRTCQFQQKMVWTRFCFWHKICSRTNNTHRQWRLEKIWKKARKECRQTVQEKNWSLKLRLMTCWSFAFFCLVAVLSNASLHVVLVFLIWGFVNNTNSGCCWDGWMNYKQNSQNWPRTCYLCVYVNICMLLVEHGISIANVLGF